MITERDLELEYQRDTGSYPTNGSTGGHTRGFYDWCLDQLLTLKNKQHAKIKQSKIDYREDFEFS